ncbi:MAG: ABC transporter ATP-binding protein/permease [Candidatus Nomurabacteria bacterium]|jgi:ABC-type multidrug transport system fused ATPase/permease subunit|nr:ABC transporter ATP-binding protein/permease [Candidatus Nomurabacteria bacterium]
MPKKLRTKFLLLAILSVATAYLASLNPIFLGKVIDSFSDGGNTLYYIAIFAGIFFIIDVLAIIRRVAVDRVNCRFEESIRGKTLAKLLKLPLSKLEANGASGELTSKINQAVSGASRFMQIVSNDFIPSVFVGIFVIIQSFISTPLIFPILILGYTVSTLLVALLQIRSQKGIREDIIRLKTKLDGDITQSINGIEQIRVLHAETAEGERLSPNIANISATESKHHVYMGLYDILKHIVKVAFFVAIFLVSFYYKISGGTVLAVVLLFQQLLKPIDEFYRFLDEISASSTKAKMLTEILNEENDDAFKIKNNDVEFVGDMVEITDYEVFSPNLEKKLSKGDKVVFNTRDYTALIAPTGAGKSSLLKGLMRLYPLTGKVRLFGKNLNETSQQELTETLHYIPQSPFFFSGSLRDNVIYGLIKNIDDDEVILALKNACIYDELLLKSRNPLGVKIQEGGKNFSGGQLKRLSLARAFLRKPKLFLLDETTANIDKNTTKKIIENLKNYTKEIGAGVVFITHEKEVVDMCNKKVELTRVK